MNELTLEMFINAVKTGRISIKFIPEIYKEAVEKATNNEK